MADAAAARREARRRRILENSLNRLQLISGKSTEDCSKGSPIRTTITDQDSHRFCSNNGVIVTEQESVDSFPSIPLISSIISDVPVTQSFEVSDGEVVSDLAFPTPRAQDTLETPLLDKLMTHKYDIVILSLFIQLLYSLVLVIDTTYLFLPVIIYSVTKMIYFPTKSNSNIANALMLLNHMSSSNIQRVIQLVQTVNFVFGDICIFLFATICTQWLCNFVENSLIT